jgi:hypothetical protein
LKPIRIIPAAITYDKHHAQTNIFGHNLQAKDSDGERIKKMVCSPNVWPLGNFYLRREPADASQPFTQLGSLWQPTDSVHHSPTHLKRRGICSLSHHKYVLQQGNSLSPKAKFAIRFSFMPVYCPGPVQDLCNAQNPGFHAKARLILVESFNFENICMTKSLQ